MVPPRPMPVVAAQHATPWVMELPQEGRTYLQAGTANPFSTGLIAFAVNIALNAVTNRIDYVKKRKTAKQAIADTVNESGKMGICTVVGIVVGNAVARTGLLFIAPSVLPITAAITATYLLKRLWDHPTARIKTDVMAEPAVVVRRRSISGRKSGHTTVRQ
ncbi:MAG: hypothetical protein HQL21_04315 [Candidatus Omnitrophica bacterium]|nr:hypothetical protein [Candidatus Omnitrophota bacterium]